MTQPEAGSADEASTRYAEALLEAFSDYLLTGDEVSALGQLEQDLGLPSETVRMVHAQVCHHLLTRFLDDRAIDVNEANHLAFIWHCLRRLGWAPGDRVAGK